MARIIYVEYNGTRHEVDASPGQSVMEAAVGNMVPGIDAECGGACACATCHIYIEPEWAAVVGSRSAMEGSMLDCASDVRDTSRLACQIKVTEAFDQLVVHMPESQG